VFFENELISFTILEVLSLKQKNINLYNCERNFCALSFRTRANTVLKTKADEISLKDGDVLFVPSRLDYNRSSKIDEMIVIHFETANCTAKDIEVFAPENPEKFRELFENILDCWNKKEVGYKYKCASIFNEILFLCHLQNASPKSSDLNIQKSVDFLLSSYKNPNLTIKEIADKSFMSEVYFRKLFKQQFGTSPQKYIIRLRIQNATCLIAAGYYSLKEIALMSGYTDYKYFSTEFKKQVGLSPSEYFYNYSK